MKIVEYPQRETWTTLTMRPKKDTSQLNAVVAEVLADVKKNGDDAVRKYEEKFDHAQLKQLLVTNEEINNALQTVSAELLDALRLAHHNIAAFHEAQRHEPVRVETAPGVVCWQRSIPIEKVGLYIPGGTAPLFSTVLMLATPAKIAGCNEIVLCTPPDSTGHVNPAILAAASVAGVSRVYKVGGVQAIGAMAYGTQSIPKVDKIFGPGNAYVMTAKQQVSLSDVAIDMPAGPSEVCVIADDTCRPDFVAADLLSQAEHGIDSQVLLISTSREVIDEVGRQMKQQLQQLARKEMAEKTLLNSTMVLVRDLQEAIALSNVYAPEHLILATDQCHMLAGKVVNAGSVFLGNYACESAGDYASGTNHTLPTHGYAKAYSGVNLDSYNKKITFQQLSPQGIRSIGKAVEIMAENEQLQAHRNAMTLRLKAVEGMDIEEGEVLGDDFLQRLTRPNIQHLAPYSSARNEYSGKEAHVFLDANENPYNNPCNRYPDPLQRELKERIAKVKGVRPEQIFLGNGSDEAIDLAFRCFTRPQKDNVVAIEPTYGMYKVCADINDVEYRPVLLDDKFQITADKLLSATDANTKIIFLCSPNNPTGNSLAREEIELTLQRFPGIVVVDEAYADFSSQRSFRRDINKYPNLIVLNTFSKAWGLAAIRLGMAFASPEIINIYNKVKYPYNVNYLTQQQALQALQQPFEVDKWVKLLLQERSRMIQNIRILPLCEHIYPSDANFILVKVSDAKRIYQYLVDKGIIVRNRTNVTLCKNCLRITIGSKSENNELIGALRQY